MGAARARPRRGFYAFFISGLGTKTLSETYLLKRIDCRLGVPGLLTNITFVLYSKYRIWFYRTAAGGCQACDYARAMDINHRAKAKRWFKALAERGPELTPDYGKHLRDEIWELRVIIQHHQHRFLYSFWEDNIVVTNAFLKKSSNVPRTEIERAAQAMADWIVRRGWELS